MIPLQTLLGYLLVSILWGCTNPFIKHAQVNAKEQAGSHQTQQQQTQHQQGIPSALSSNKLSHTLTSNKQSSTLLTSSTTSTATSSLLISSNNNNNNSSSSTGSKASSESVFQTLKRFVQDLNVLIPWVFNQLGSVVFFMLLSTEPISIASPVANSLTFLFTAITSYTVFNERVRYPWLLFLGTAFIVGGTALCMV